MFRRVRKAVACLAFSSFFAFALFGGCRQTAATPDGQPPIDLSGFDPVLLETFIAL